MEALKLTSKSQSISFIDIGDVSSVSNSIEPDEICLNIWLPKKKTDRMLRREQERQRNREMSNE